MTNTGNCKEISYEPLTYHNCRCLASGLAPAFALEDTSKPQDPSSTKSEAGQLPAHPV